MKRKISAVAVFLFLSWIVLPQIGLSQEGHRIDINHATYEELVALPGIGPTIAQGIIKYRETKGRFHSVDELLEIKGIGPKRLERLRPFISINPSEEK